MQKHACPSRTVQETPEARTPTILWGRELQKTSMHRNEPSAAMQSTITRRGHAPARFDVSVRSQRSADGDVLSAPFYRRRTSALSSIATLYSEAELSILVARVC